MSEVTPNKSRPSSAGCCHGVLQESQGHQIERAAFDHQQLVGILDA
jgi:hypothetical protein